MSVVSAEPVALVEKTQPRGVTWRSFLLGTIVCLNIEEIRRFLSWLTNTELFSPELYFLSKLPADMNLKETLAVLVMALGLSLLATLYPSKTSAELWAMEGNTMLPGIDDYPRKTEVTYLADAQDVRDFARANGIGTLSFWAIQRDNGGCPGLTDSNSCSGIVQGTWDFSHLLEPFAGRP